MEKIALVFLCSLLALLLISSHHSTSARLLPATHQDEQVIEVASEIADATPTLNPQEEDMASLMGLEECEENDEACLKRRMVAEAHLDYIYTQKNKPKP